MSKTPEKPEEIKNRGGGELEAYLRQGREEILKLCQIPKAYLRPREGKASGVLACFPPGRDK